MRSPPPPLKNPFFRPKSPFYGLAGLGLALLLGCQDTQPRVYTEVAFKPLAASMPNGPMSGGMGPMAAGGMPAMSAAPVDIKVTWKLPEGWTTKDSANAMRIGSFAATDPDLANSGEIDPNAVDVSVVQLAGDAGGLKANIMRWMGQVGVKMGPEDLEAFIKAAARFKTASGQEGMFVDLTDKLSGDMTQDKTIYGAIVQTKEYTVFVKAMGEMAKVQRQKPIVKAFSQSLRIEGPKS